jgi:hypothetical protein
MVAFSENQEPSALGRGWMSSVLIAALLCMCVVSIAAMGQTKKGQKAAAPSPVTVGQWAAPVNFCTYPCMVGADAAVLNSGKVLFYYYPAANTQNSLAMLLDPASGKLTDVSLPVSEDIFCSGLSILPSGKVLVTGGNIEGKCSHTASGCGTKNSMLFDPATSTWSTAADMGYARWYPSSVELTDGTLLEMSGTDDTGQFVQKPMEFYNQTTGKWTTLPSTANLPNDVTQVYPRLNLMPNGKVFLSSPAANTYQFDPATNAWSFVASVNFGHRYFAPHVLLPGQEKILVAGGTLDHLNGGGDATNTAEIIDMSAATPAWTYTGAMTSARYNENLVLLADGTVLAVGGGGGGGRYSNPVLTSELYDPKTGQWTLMAAQQVQRTYHSTAVLMPDGRVVSAGSDDGEATQVTYEIYSPPYMFKGVRPVIQSAPTSVGYNAKFSIATPSASAITRVALVRPGATTHADNFDQRYVDLTYSVVGGMIQATSPANGNAAPPGYYMLVIVNSKGIPSVMRFVQLH